MKNPICPKCKTNMVEKGVRILPERIWVTSGRFGPLLTERPEEGEIIFMCPRGCMECVRIPVKIRVEVEEEE